MHCERKGNCVYNAGLKSHVTYIAYIVLISIVVIFLDNTIDSTFCLFNNIIANIGY